MATTHQTNGFPSKRVLFSSDRGNVLVNLIFVFMILFCCAIVGQPMRREVFHDSRWGVVTPYVSDCQCVQRRPHVSMHSATTGLIW